MKKAAVILLRNNASSEVLLGYKKNGFGAGKYSIIGGKVHPGETPSSAVMRELFEETGIHVAPESLYPNGRIKFFFPARPDWNLAFHIFTSYAWEGLPDDSTEISPHWFTEGRLPYTKMWPDTAIWLPPVLQGKFIKAHFVYKNDNETLRSGKIRFW